MRAKPIHRRRIRRTHPWLAITALLTIFAGAKGSTGQTQVNPRSNSSVPLVIQGEITAIEGDLATVKTPNGYPGGPGVHAMNVTAGRAIRVDTSHARILLPDGGSPDKQPLAVGEHIVVVIESAPGAALEPLSPRGSYRTYAASVIERTLQGGKVITH